MSGFFSSKEKTNMTGKRYRTTIEDSEEDGEYGEVKHPIGSEFIVGDPMHDDEGSYAVLWQGEAVAANGEKVPASGMWCIWTPDEIRNCAEEIV